MRLLMSDLQSWLSEHDPLRVVCFDDEIVDRLGYPVRSRYAETFWLPVLGPSALWALRRIAGWLEAEPDGIDFELGELGRLLGLTAGSGRSAAVVRTLARLGVFAMARPHGDEFAARRVMPPLTQRQAQRLPRELRALHARELRLGPGVDRPVNAAKSPVNAPPSGVLTAEAERVQAVFGEVAASPASAPLTSHVDGTGGRR